MVSVELPSNRLTLAAAALLLTLQAIGPCRVVKQLHFSRTDIRTRKLWTSAAQDILRPVANEARVSGSQYNEVGILLDATQKATSKVHDALKQPSLVVRQIESE